MKFFPTIFCRFEWAIALIVIGSRLAVFSYAGSPLPYYDQWISEFNSTLFSVSLGQDYGALLNPHNEHILATTKILTLLGYLINGYWDIPFLVICSAVVRAFTAAWIFQLISKSAQPKTEALLGVLCAVIFAVPFSGFNFLNGMQVCFYSAELALVWSLRTTTNWGTPVASGLALVGGTLFGLVSLASAVAIPACTLAAHLFQERPRRGFWFAWILSAMLAAGFILRGKTAGGMATETHRSLYDIAHFWLRIISWPMNLASAGVMVAFLSAIALVVAFKHPRSQRSAPAIILGLGVYSVLNAAFIAIGRDQTEWHMRHWDINALLPLATLAFGIRLADLEIHRKPLQIFMGMTVLVYALCLGNLVRTVSWPYIREAHDNRSVATDHYRMLLLKQDLHTESMRMNMLLEARNYSFFDDSIGRFSLNPVVLENLLALHRRPLAMLSPEIIPGRSPSKFSQFTAHLIASGWLLGLLGTVLGVAAMFRARRRPPDATTAPT